jgi:hypothetical protein
MYFKLYEKLGKADPKIHKQKEIIKRSGQKLIKWKLKE